MACESLALNLGSQVFHSVEGELLQSPGALQISHQGVQLGPGAWDSIRLPTELGSAALPPLF